MKYTIEWTDNEMEVYDTRSERNARVNSLENVGYVMGEDFNIGVMFE